MRTHLHSADVDANATFDDQHFDNAAADFVRFLHLIEPVTGAIRAHLPRLEPGALVVDLACGTGEPGLTLAREAPDTQVLGIDASHNMIATARETAAREQLANIRFVVAPIDGPDVADSTVDAVISRFGALQFGEPEATAKQVSRILTSAGAVSLAVWDESATNTFFQLSANALSRHVGDILATAGQLDRLAVAGQRERWLRESGLRQVDSELFRWDYRFADADAAWAMVVGRAMFGGAVEGLGDDELRDVQSAFVDSLQPYRASGSAGYAIPQTCRLIWGST